MVFFTFIIVEYQSFTTSKYHQRYAENIMNFEHPTFRRKLAQNIFLLYSKKLAATPKKRRNP